MEKSNANKYQINGKPIAAMIEISQTLLMGGDGIIESINPTEGSFTLVGGTTMRINDPDGVYSVGYALNPLFTADDENPSISAFSGFPMCIPRSSGDPKCPASNRPAGQSTFPAPNPLAMAPFIVGDYIEYSGIRVGNEVIAYSIVAQGVQITTSTGQPTYVRMEDAVIGVYDADPNSEFGDTRFIGYVSNPADSIVVYAIEVDPCTNQTTDRLIGSASPKAGDIRNKFTFRADANSITSYTREYKIVASSGTKTTNDGIIAGQYIQPVTEWIFPEANVPGIITPPRRFDLISPLANGYFFEGEQYGQLKPWPGAATPTPTKICTAPVPSSTNMEVPIAFAGADIAQNPGSLVTLIGQNNKPTIPDANLVYTWTQVSGPTVTLSGTGATVSFTAPAQAAATAVVNREFKLTVSQASDSAISSTDNVIVKTDTSIKDTIQITSYTWTSTQSGTISVTAKTNYIVDGNAKLQLFLNPSTAAITMVNSGGGVWSYSSRSTKQPAGGVTVKSSFGSSATLTTRTAKKRSLHGMGI
jgi:hypothetical protein